KRLAVGHVKQVAARLAMGDDRAIFDVKAVGRLAGLPAVKRLAVEQFLPFARQLVVSRAGREDQRSCYEPGYKKSNFHRLHHWNRMATRATTTTIYRNVPRFSSTTLATSAG